MNLPLLALGWWMLRGRSAGRVDGDYRDDTSAVRALDRAQHVGAIRPPPPRTVSKDSGQHPAPPPPPEGQSPDEAWHRMATTQANTVIMYEQSQEGLGRPPANSQPADISAWLKDRNLSPLYLYPEFGWGPSDGKPLERHAAYDLGERDHVEWWAALDGTWSYHHVWGGTDLGRLIDQIASIAAQALDATGQWGLAAMIQTAQAIVDHKPIGELAQAIKADWDEVQDEARIVFSVMTGDWGTAWDAATDFGRDLQPLLDSFKGQPAPDRNGLPILDQPSPLPHPMPPPLDHPLRPGLASVGGYRKAPRRDPRAQAKRRKR